MNKKNIKIKCLMILFLVISLGICSKVKATTISVSPRSPQVGDTVEITVSVPNVNTASVTANVTGAASGTIKVVGGDVSGAATTFSKTERFQCNSEGKINVAITGDSTAVLDGQYVDVGASVSIDVSAKPVNNNEETNSNSNNNTDSQNNNDNNQESTETKKSSNANLSNLWITPIEYDFKGFKTWNRKYTHTVPNNVEQISIHATLAKDSANAEITSGLGNQKLNVGDNKFNIVITAEDGTTKTYTLNVVREEVNAENNTTSNETVTEETTETTEIKDVDSDLIKLEVEGYNLTPSFTPAVYEYKLNVSEDVNSINVITEGANKDISIELSGNTDLQDGENVVTILVYNPETKKNSTYQIIVTKSVINTEDANEVMNAAIKKANFIRKIFLGALGFILIGIVVFIIVRHRYYSEDYDYEDDEFDDSSEDRINLDEEEELFNRVNKEAFRKSFKKKEVEKENKQEVLKEEETSQEDTESDKAKKKGKHF